MGTRTHFKTSLDRTSEKKGAARQMSRHSAWIGSGVLLLGLSVALVAATPASASSDNSKAPHHNAKRGSSKGSSTSEFVKLGPLECPRSSIITTATSTTFKGPNSQNGGTAACIYQDQTGNELNVIYDSPGESKSKWVAADPSNIGEPAPAVPGLGEAAFETTTLGHAEVDIYESSSEEVAVTLDPYDGASVTPEELTEVLAVGHSLVRLPYPG
jgi:hypothetical protein